MDAVTHGALALFRVTWTGDAAMPSLVALLRKREGCEYTVYKDPVKANRPTVGIGHLVTPADKLKLGDKIEEAQVQAFFKKDTTRAVAAAKSQAAKAGITDGQFIIYLASVNFQLGTTWNRTFKRTWGLILEGKYPEAAKEVQKSRWFGQTPIRVKDFQGALLALPAKAPK